MNERDAFLEALARNEDDTPTRLVYADWLDEQGEHEEADRQRKWPAAKEWLVRFCRRFNPHPDDEDPDYWDFVYFSFVVGMTCQVSDVAVASQPIRRTVIAHGVVSFFFNTALLALTVNIAASAI